MTAQNKLQVEGLVAAVTDFASSRGPNNCAEVEDHCKLLLYWLKYLQSYQLTGTADELLAAVAPSLREVAATLSLGIIRPALFALRSQIDLVLTWLYFKDHPIEWDYVNATGEGFKMKKEITSYLATHNDAYGTRFGILKGIAKRTSEEPYHFLSAHIHGQSIAVLSNTGDLKDIVRSQSECNECVKAVYEVAEYLNDVLLSVYANSWASLPIEIQQAVSSRFVTPEQRATFSSANKSHK